MKTIINLEEEAKAYKKPATKPTKGPITARRYFAGQAMTVLMTNLNMSMAEIKRESYAWADYMLEDQLLRDRDLGLDSKGIKLRFDFKVLFK